MADVDENSAFESIPSQRYQDKLDQLLLCIKNRLSDLDYQIVQLSIVSDFSSQRVATEIGFSADNVRQRLSRSIKKLRRHCQDIWSNSQDFSL